MYTDNELSDGATNRQKNTKYKKCRISPSVSSIFIIYLEGMINMMMHIDLSVTSCYSAQA